MINQKFEDYFSEIFRERWPTLRAALLEDEKQIAFSPFEDSLLEILKNPTAYLADSRETEKYILDPASLLPVLALDLKSGQDVLDLCAAPGGKSLAILGQIVPGNLTANDSSKDRMVRLKRVLKQYSPQKYHENFQVFLSDGRTFFKTQKKYDAALVDVPCSSERHLLKNEKYLKLWTPKQAQMLSVKQYTLLCTALLCTKPGGFITYSTCSINPVENDEVIRKVLKKKSETCTLDLPDLTALSEHIAIEKTEFGYWILPDRTDFGPIYVSRLRTK